MEESIARNRICIIITPGQANPILFDKCVINYINMFKNSSFQLFMCVNRINHRKMQEFDKGMENEKEVFRLVVSPMRSWTSDL